MRRLTFACVAAAGLLVGTVAQGGTEPDPKSLTNAAFLATVKARIPNGMPAGDAGGTRFVFRNLRLLSITEGTRRVCGEVAPEGGSWRRFHADLEGRPSVEPFPDIHKIEAQALRDQCHEAAAKHTPGTTPRPEDIRACRVGGVLAEAQWQRARFDMLHLLSCAEEVYPVLMRTDG